MQTVRLLSCVPSHALRIQERLRRSGVSYDLLRKVGQVQTPDGVWTWHPTLGPHTDVLELELVPE